MKEVGNRSHLLMGEGTVSLFNVLRFVSFSCILKQMLLQSLGMVF